MSTIEDNVIEAVGRLLKIKNLNELLFMAGEGMISSNRDVGNAITTGCDVINDLLEEVLLLLDREGGAA